MKKFCPKCRMSVPVTLKRDYDRDGTLVSKKTTCDWCFTTIEETPSKGGTNEDKVL